MKEGEEEEEEEEEEGVGTSGGEVEKTCGFERGGETAAKEGGEERSATGAEGGGETTERPSKNFSVSMRICFSSWSGSREGQCLFAGGRGGRGRKIGRIHGEEIKEEKRTRQGNERDK